MNKGGRILVYWTNFRFNQFNFRFFDKREESHQNSINKGVPPNPHQLCLDTQSSKVKMDIDLRTRTEIITLYQYANKSQREISRIVGVSKSSVDRIVKNDVDPKRKGRCGRKKKASPEAIQMMISESERNPRNSSSDLRNYLASLGVQVTSRTVRGYLLKAGRRARRPIKKQLLTEEMKRKRLAWAETYKEWTKEDWRKVLFSDESHFLVQGQHSQYVRRSKNEEIREDHMNQFVKNPQKRMFWGSFSYTGVGSLYPIEGIMNGDKYMQVINNKVLPDMQDAFPNNDGIFQQDLAPCHRANKVKQLFSEKGISLLDWPGNSPDLNPIENLWAIVKLEARKRDCTTLHKMTLAIIDIWFHDPKILQHCSKLVDSMPERVKEVIQKRGGHIKY